MYDHMSSQHVWYMKQNGGIYGFGRDLREYITRQPSGWIATVGEKMSAKASMSIKRHAVWILSFFNTKGRHIQTTSTILPPTEVDTSRLQERARAIFRGMQDIGVDDTTNVYNYRAKMTTVRRTE